MPSTKIVPVILSGGSGTRLWPLSRTGRPKQLIALTHDDTMLQLTARRTPHGARFDAPIVVAGAAHADIIEEQLRAIGVLPAALILEPMARNTAPAIALAAAAADPAAILLVMPSDHVIADPDAFRAAIDRALPMVADGALATFGIEPEGPETGYGYIQAGPLLDDGVHAVARFVEKPDRATAQSYLDAGGHYWNGGIFLFRADAYMAALDAHAPAIADAARAALTGSAREAGRIFPDPVAFAGCPSDSIDYAVMEKADRVVVVPVAMGWSDVGSWDALHQLAARDGDGNAIHGDVVAIDTRGCLIRTDGPLVAMVGVSDLIVVATGDAILILPRGESQEVKRAIAALKERGHVTLDRPFGSA
ncbi:MAG TPA: mannose-1-phosphate guanylyltransferase/mannose-6-phosphate isomerase [Sphingomonas sp.]|jgi:mannose-1-phosphate guanylyltransferase/mannose-1-phosphate guanylyltransferase/mannose-6-phosphate isomerase|uniref:mannose-1-phosphate guanylyltransferase/mannose-6-phosphate isomerase n=1 Tax=Sphingomonas sp. TaxID=28214 RepID=UPI002ED86BE4